MSTNQNQYAVNTAESQTPDWGVVTQPRNNGLFQPNYTSSSRDQGAATQDRNDTRAPPTSGTWGGGGSGEGGQARNGMAIGGVGQGGRCENGKSFGGHGFGGGAFGDFSQAGDGQGGAASGQDPKAGNGHGGIAYERQN